MEAAFILIELDLTLDSLTSCANCIGTTICTQSLCTRAVQLLFIGNYDECVEQCDILLNYIWEKLNTGHWKDVKLSWRNLYYLVSILKGICLARNNLESALKCCDNGLILGAPVLNNALTKLAQYLHDDIVQRNTNYQENTLDGSPRAEISCPPISLSSNIERMELPSVIDFQLDYLKRSKPVVITGLITKWPAFNEWSLSKLQKRMGYRSVPVEIGSSYTDEQWTQKIMTVNEFIHKYMIMRDGEGMGYLAQHQLFQQIPSLKEDILIPDYCFTKTCDEEDVDINAWFGPGGTVSPLHQDPRQNLLCQVFGSKYIRLYDVAHTDRVYPLQNSMMKNTSEIDVENIDSNRYPLMKDLDFMNCILKPGDVLFIPQGWWHFVKSLNNSFSVSFWFD